MRQEKMNQAEEGEMETQGREKTGEEGEMEDSSSGGGKRGGNSSGTTKNTHGGQTGEYLE